MIRRTVLRQDDLARRVMHRVQIRARPSFGDIRGQGKPMAVELPANDQLPRRRFSFEPTRPLRRRIYFSNGWRSWNELRTRVLRRFVEGEESKKIFQIASLEQRLDPFRHHR